MALTKIRGNTQIQALTVTNSEIALPDAANPLGILLTKIEDGTQLVKADGSVSFTAPISGVAPTDGGHLATKDYVDATAQGLDVKESVRVVATDNITMSGTQTIDGIVLDAGDRVLLAGQTNPVQNGIYTVNAGAWTRTPDATTAADVTPGLFTFVEEGTVGAGTGWVLTSTGPTTLGTTELPFAQFSAAGVIQSGAGLTKTGNTIDVVSANGAIVVNADNIALTLDGSTLSVGASGLKLADIGAGNVMVGDASGHGRGVTISGDITIDANGVASIAPGAVGAATIGNGSLALNKLVSGTAGQIIVVGADGVPAYVAMSGDASITAAGDLQLVANSVGTTEIANAAVTAPKLATDSVTTIKIVDGAVTEAKLASDSVSTLKIVDGAVTGPKLADDSVTSAKLATDSVTADAIADDAVDTAAIVDAAVTLAKLETLASGTIIMGSGAGNVAVTLSGDVTVSAAGVVTINPATVVRVTDIVKRETPVGAINGANTTFTLANTPKAGTVDVYVNGILQDEGAGNDYTISGDTIEMLYALTSGDKLRASYFK